MSSHTAVSIHPSIYSHLISAVPRLSTGIFGISLSFILPLLPPHPNLGANALSVPRLHINFDGTISWQNIPLTPLTPHTLSHSFPLCPAKYCAVICVSWQSLAPNNQSNKAPIADLRPLDTLIHATIVDCAWRATTRIAPAPAPCPCPCASVPVPALYHPLNPPLPDTFYACESLLARNVNCPDPLLDCRVLAFDLLQLRN